MNKPLEGLKVLDLSQFLSASYCTMLLSGMGAEVIKLERPGSGDPARISPPFGGPDGVGLKSASPEDLSLAILKRCRNKRSITLNLNVPEGKQIFLELVKHFDIVVENFRPGTMEKLGLSYEVLRGVNPGIIFGSISGFGEVEKYRNFPAFDIVIQAISGLMSTNGAIDGPPTKTSIAISDQAAGLFLCIGLLSALANRLSTGNGDKVSVSLLDSIIALLMDEAPDFWQRNGQPERSGSRLTRLTPFNSYTARNGNFVIASGNDKHWQRIADAMGRPDLAADPAYAKLVARVANADQVDTLINEWGAQHSVDEVLESLRAAGIPCAEVRSVPDMLFDEALLEAGLVGNLSHPTAGALEGAMVGRMPIRFENATSDFDCPAPFMGQDNVEIYRKYLGYDKAKVEKLKENGLL